MDSELVLCLPAAFCADRFREGFTPVDDQMTLARMIDGARDWSLRPRAEVEDDPAFRHLVVYTVVHTGNQVFRYRRGRAGAEARLHDRYSIGVGGHIDWDDLPEGVDANGLAADAHQVFRTAWSAARREVREELTAPPFLLPALARFEGWLLDSSSPVNRVHLGLVFSLDMVQPGTTARDDGLAEPEWLPWATVHQQRDNLETWSRHLIDAGVVARRHGHLVPEPV